MSDRKGIGGPKTEAGKNISKMNGLKHGLYVKKFHHIPANKSGRLKICLPCGQEQQESCKINGACYKQNEMLLRYTLMHEEHDPDYVEGITVGQLAMMDFLLTQMIGNLALNLGETQKVVKDGKEYSIPKVRNEDIRIIIDLINTLKKTPADMQLTRATQQATAIEIAKLLEAKINPDLARDFKQEVLESAGLYDQAAAEAEELRANDTAIQNYLKTGSLESTDELPSIPKKNPFSDA